MTAEDLAFAPAHQLLTALEKGETTSRELVDLYLDRIRRIDTELNSVVTLDTDRARSQADEADRQRATGAELGVLHGLPVTTKDSYETAGMRSSCGRADLADHVPTQDAEAVIRLRRAGAIIMGKTNMPPGNQDVQADNPLFGPTNNPWNHARTSGGSAGGGAVATAAGLTGFDFGSEIGGSTRIPSHFVGIYGHKATYRSIPLVGHLVPGPGVNRWSEPDLACAGAQVRDARDLVPILAATTGPMERDGGFRYELAEPRARQLADFRVAVWYDDPDCPVDAEVTTAMGAAVEALRAAGATVDIHPAAIPVTLGESHRTFQPLLFSQLGIDRSGMTPALGASMLARIAQSPSGDAAKALRGTFLSHHGWMQADARRQEMRERAVDPVLRLLRHRPDARLTDCRTSTPRQAPRQVRQVPHRGRSSTAVLGPDQVVRPGQHRRGSGDDHPHRTRGGFRAAGRHPGHGARRRRSHHDRVRGPARRAARRVPEALVTPAADGPTGRSNKGDE